VYSRAVVRVISSVAWKQLASRDTYPRPRLIYLIISVSLWKYGDCVSLSSTLIFSNILDTRVEEVV
jgi:hypothetical protein